MEAQIRQSLFHQMQFSLPFSKVSLYMVMDNDSLLHKN